MPEPGVVAILGAGALGGAIARGIAAADDGPALLVTNRTAAKADALSDLAGVRSLSLEHDPEANRAAAAEADIVLVGVKPAMVADLLAEIAPALRPGVVVVSLAAGVTIATCEAALPEGVAVLRAMPNTPVLVRQGVTGLAAGSAATPADLVRVRRVFEAVGVVVVLTEDRIDALSTISGSGPAYVYLLVERFTDAARAKGFDDTTARVLAEQAFVGAAALLDASEADPAELRRRVTSPKGTTERAIAVLDDADLAGLFTRATDAALARARELASGG